MNRTQREMLWDCLKLAPKKFRNDDDIIFYVRALEEVAYSAQYYMENEDPGEEKFLHHMLTVSLDHLFGVHSA